MWAMAVSKKDKERYQKLVDLGCIVCLKDKGLYTPPEIHHPYGRTKDGNQKTYGLCFYHHRQGGNCDEYVSRHPWLSEFEDRYGSEEYLLEETNKLIK